MRSGPPSRKHLMSGYWLDAPRHIDGDAGDEVGVARGEEADDPGLVARLRHAPERSAVNLLRLLLRRPLLPARPNALGQGHAGRDGIHGNAEGPSSCPSFLVRAIMPPFAVA